MAAKKPTTSKKSLRKQVTPKRAGRVGAHMDTAARAAIPFDDSTGLLYHGTRADFKPGDLIQPGHASNYTERRSPWVYFSATLHAATWGAELARGDGPSRIYVAEPTGPYVDDPNLTDKKFPGNPTKSYRSQSPLRVLRELLDWTGRTDEEILAMKDAIQGKEPIDD